MKALSLWQPWASAVAYQSKLIETRHWSTNYRGPIAIHAAKRKIISELIHYSCIWQWQGAMRESGIRFGDKSLHEVLPFGAIVAVADLVDCRPTESFTNGELDTPRRPKDVDNNLYDWTERIMGDFSLGRFGWMLSNIRRLDVPVPFVGRQGLFNVPDALLIQG